MAGDKEVKVPGQPTANEAMFFYHILVNMKTKPDIDWDAVANAQGLKSAEVAKVRFGQVKRKLNIKDPASAKKPTTASSTSSPSASTTTTTADPKTPTKVKKATGRVGGKKAAVKSEVEKTPDFLKESEDDGAVKQEPEGPKTPKEPTFEEWIGNDGN